MLPGALPLAMTSLVGVAISVLWMIENEMVLYIMFALLVFYNAFIFGVCISFLLRVYVLGTCFILLLMVVVVAFYSCTRIFWEGLKNRLHFYLFIF